MRVWVLSYAGKPIGVAYRFERLNEHMANYTAAEQTQMVIAEVEVLT